MARRGKSKIGGYLMVALAVIAVIAFVVAVLWFGLWREYMIMTRVYGWSPAVATGTNIAEAVFSVIIIAAGVVLNIFE